MITPRSARSIVGAVVAVSALALLAGCSSEPEPIQTAPRGLVMEGTLGPAAGNGPARTYDPALAPEGASMHAELGSWREGTQLTVRVQGFLPNRSYPVRAHMNVCGPTGDAAGPDYQNNPDPLATDFRPSTNPVYANPLNEMWLDLRTDAAGAGSAMTTVAWAITNEGPSSVVVQDPAAGSGVAGSAGGRVACLSLR